MYIMHLPPTGRTERFALADLTHREVIFLHRVLEHEKKEGRLSKREVQFYEDLHARVLPQPDGSTGLITEN